MAQPTAPDDVDHAGLRELAREAAWVAKLEDAVQALQDLVRDLVADDAGDEESAIGGLEDPLEVALLVLEAAYEEADAALEEQAAAWLAVDPEHWPIFRLVVLDPWQVAPGRWRNAVPGWVRVLGTDAVLAHYQQDPFGRRREPDH